MTVRLARLLVFSLIAIGFAAPAQAQWFGGSSPWIVRETKRRNCWPQPFVYADRQAVRAPMALMISNGWRRQNLLADHHFNPENGQLTEAGQLKIRWIATEAPRAHRTVYVRIAPTAAQTAARVANVHGYVAQTLPEISPPSVQVTSITGPEWSAAKSGTAVRALEAAAPTIALP